MTRTMTMARGVRLALLPLLLAAAVFALVRPGAGAQTTDLVIGDLPSNGGFAIGVLSASATPAQIVDELEGRGCAPIVLAVTVDGVWALYGPNSPDFANANFPSPLPQAAGFVVNCGTGTGTPSEPTPQDAVNTLQSYYQAINAGEYETAYLLWRDNGAASGQTLEEFTAGYAETESVTATIGTPGQVEGAAGSRFIEIPVTIASTTTGGEDQTFTGTIVLQRSVVDGATPAQRAWGIFSADLTES